MSQAIRDAAQALIDIVMQQCGATHLAGPGFEAAEKARALRAALSAPQPVADERVAEHMRLVAAYGAQVQRDAFSGASLTLKLDVHDPDYSRIVAVEASARALLSASQEDARATVAALQVRINELEARQVLASARDEYVVVWPDGGRCVGNTLKSAQDYMSGAVPSCAERGVEPPVIVRYVPAETVPYAPQPDTSKEQPADAPPFP